MNADDSVIGDDGLPLTEVGAWTVEKHERLIAYVNIARAVRQKFAKTETTYIELFSGPGRSIIKQDGRIIEGSPILAARTAKDQRVPFRDIHLADFEPSYVDAVRKRLPPNVGNIHSYVGAAETTVNRIALSLNPDGLACTRFRRHRGRCFDGAGVGSWRDGSLPASSSLRLCG